jgi:hypothetical protein
MENVKVKPKTNDRTMASLFNVANKNVLITGSSATSITSFPPPVTPQITLEASVNTEQSPVRSPLSTKTPIRILRLYPGILIII